MNIMEVIRAPKVRRSPRSVKAWQGKASVVAHWSGNNRAACVFTPFIKAFAAVLAFCTGCV